jgi:SWI/SNF related-matrix-associated actin-dependent regulator of chromatin subfamily C
LCPKAFKEGRFPPGTCGKDFRRFIHGVDQSQKESGKIWSLQENLLLLEAIDYYKSDWDAIAKHVGGKTRVECLQHFLKLPIETSLIPRALDLVDNEPPLKLEGGKAVTRYISEPLPFAGMPNHLISTLSVIMSLISGEVAGAAAKGALEYLLDTVQNSEKPLEVPISDDQVDKATHAALETAAIRAKELAHQRMREMQELVINMSEVQLERILAKLDHMYSLEEAAKEEIEIVNARRHRALKRTEELQAASVTKEEKITTN